LGYPVADRLLVELEDRGDLGDGQKPSSTSGGRRSTLMLAA